MRFSTEGIANCRTPDVPEWFLGLRPDVQLLSDLGNASVPPEQRARMFTSYVSGYFKHRSITSRKFEDLKMELTDEIRTSTTDRMTEDEYNSAINSGPIARSDILHATVSGAEFKTYALRALFDDEMAHKYWPALSVDVIWCEHSLWQCVNSGWEYQNLREEFDKKGVAGRPLRVFMLPGANHFVSIFPVNFIWMRLLTRFEATLG